jgi:hypothetical protein
MKSSLAKIILLFFCAMSTCYAQSKLNNSFYGDFPKNLKVTVTQAEPLIGERLRINIAITPIGKANVTIPWSLLPWNSCDTPFYFVVIVEGVGVTVPKYCASPYPASDVVIKAGHTERHTFVFDIPELKGKNPKKNLINFIWLVRHSKNYGPSGIVEIK